MEGMEGKAAEARSFWISVDSDHAALLLRLIIIVEIAGDYLVYGVFSG